MRQGQQVAARTQTGDHAGGDARDQRVPVGWRARMDVGQMDLDDRSREHPQCIEKRDRGKRIAGGVDDDRARRVDGFVDPVDKLAFAVGLPECDLVSGGGRPALGLDLGEGSPAVDVRLAGAEPIEVGPIQNEDRFRSASWLIVTPRSRTAVAARVRAPGRR